MITFFFGILAAWWVVSLKNERMKIILDGLLTLPLVLPPTVAGFFLLYLFGVKRPIGIFFLQYFGVKIAFSWTGHGACGSGDVLSAHVPLCKGSV